MNREDVTDLIIEAKVRKGIKWADVATQVGLSKEWVTAACLGQMTLTAEQAATIGDILGVDLPRPRSRLQLAENPHYHHLRGKVLEFLYQRQMRPAA